MKKNIKVGRNLFLQIDPILVEKAYEKANSEGFSTFRALVETLLKNYVGETSESARTQ